MDVINLTSSSCTLCTCIWWGQNLNIVFSGFVNYIFVFLLDELRMLHKLNEITNSYISLKKITCMANWNWANWWFIQSSSLCFPSGKMSMVPTAFMQVKSVISLPLPEEVHEATIFLPSKLKTLLCLCWTVVIYISSMLKILWVSWLTFYCMRNRDSIVGIATGYGLDNRVVGVWFPVGLSIFSSPCRPDRLWGPTQPHTSYPMGTGDYILGG
jgi:hypothetical protein